MGYKIIENIPGGKSCNTFIIQIQFLSGKIQSGGNFNPDGIIAVYLRLRLTGKDFSVSRIGKVMPVLHFDNTIQSLISQHNALLSQCSPEERQQSLTTFFRIIAPEFFP